jgi:SfnB family sulfur acquisition oxidoreductase
MNQTVPVPPRTRPVPKLAARSRPAHRIRDDAEAIATAHRLAETFAKGASERDRERRLPWAEMEAYSDSGLLAMTVPKAYGGAEVSAVTLAEVVAIISAADGSLGQIPQSHFYMVEALRLDAPEDMKRFFFERVLYGDRLGNALSEIGGKHAGDYKTYVRRDGEGWRLDGRKFYCTGALFAHWVACVAVTPDARRRHICFLPRDTTPGLTLVDDWSGFGQKTTGSGTTIFEDIAVPATHVFDHEKAFERPTRMGSLAQIIHAAIDVGIARGAFTIGLDHLRKHARPYGASGLDKVTDDPHMLATVGDLRVRMTAADAMLERAGEHVDRAGAEPTEANVVEASIAVAEAKITGNDVALLLGSKLFEMTGTRAVLEALNLDIFWRNGRTHTLHDPVRWKYHFVGDFWLNGKAPPRTGTL